MSDPLLPFIYVIALIGLFSVTTALGFILGKAFGEWRNNRE